MRLAKIEAALERLFEGAVGRVIGGRLHPLEVYRALWRALEDGRIISAGAKYAPNRLTARLNPQDMAAVEGIRERLEAEFAVNLEDEARAEGLRFGARILVRLEGDEAVRAGSVAVTATLDHSPLAAALVAESGVLAGRRLALRDGAVLGRAADCDLAIPDEAVSRRHCRFDWLLEGYRITDLGSSNGTVVNDVQVSEYVLGEGDLVTVGATRLRFRYT